MKKLLAATVGLLVCGSAFANPPDIGQTVVTFNCSKILTQTYLNGKSDDNFLLQHSLPLSFDLGLT